MRRPAVTGRRLTWAALVLTNVLAVFIARHGQNILESVALCALCAAWTMSAASLITALHWGWARLRATEPPDPDARMRWSILGGALMISGVFASLADAISVNTIVQLCCGAVTLVAVRLTSQSILLIVTPFLAFTVLHESETFSLWLGSDHVESRWNWSGSSNCTGTNWDGPATLISLRAVPFRELSSLSGAVGRRMRPARTDYGADGRLYYSANAQIDPVGPACYLPGWRHLSWQGTVQITLHARSQRGARQLTCSGHQTLQADVRIQSTGLGSCARLQRKLAAALDDQIDTHLRQLSGL
jgi:hypothetical protein